MMKRKIMGILLSIVAVSAVMAAPPYVPMVDIPDSEKEIADKQERNENLGILIDQLAQENDLFLGEISKAETQISYIDATLFKMRDKGDELLILAKQITDPDTAETTRSAVLKNNDLIRQMNNTRNQLDRVIYIYKQRLQSNRRIVSDSTKEISRNEDRVDFLVVAVTRSKKVNDSVSSYMTEVDQYLSETETFLGGIEELLIISDGAGIAEKSGGATPTTGATPVPAE